MKSKLIKFYDQTLEYFTRNWCWIYTLFNIIQIQWGVQVDNKFIIETLKLAETEKAWYQTWGAYFQKLYNWFVLKIYERTKLKVNVRTVNIMSDEFEELVNKWYAFGLWLKFAWSWYRTARKDWKITVWETLIDTAQYTPYGHNHTFFKWVIKDSLFEEVIKMDLETLRSAVKNWIYYSNARTLILEDQLLDSYLKKYQKWEVINDIELLPKSHQKAIARASKLRVFKK